MSYRVGRTLGTTIYKDAYKQPVAMVFNCMTSEELAARIVRLLNEDDAAMRGRAARRAGQEKKKAGRRLPSAAAPRPELSPVIQTGAVRGETPSPTGPKDRAARGKR